MCMRESGLPRRLYESAAGRSARSHRTKREIDKRPQGSHLLSARSTSSPKCASVVCPSASSSPSLPPLAALSRSSETTIIDLPFALRTICFSRVQHRLLGAQVRTNSTSRFNVAPSLCPFTWNRPILSGTLGRPRSFCPLSTTPSPRPHAGSPPWATLITIWFCLSASSILASPLSVALLIAVFTPSLPWRVPLGHMRLCRDNHELFPSLYKIGKGARRDV
ncbi:hypothetical protein OH77DRAFT_1281364 [Trametes cingulata]|nr:hypothetical protein OH77DRAFT_1281364 [Trametes cingulata]